MHSDDSTLFTFRCISFVRIFPSMLMFHGLVKSAIIIRVTRLIAALCAALETEKTQQNHLCLAKQISTCSFCYKTNEKLKRRNEPFQGALRPLPLHPLPRGGVRAPRRVLPVRRVEGPVQQARLREGTAARHLAVRSSILCFGFRVRAAAAAAPTTYSATAARGCAARRTRGATAATWPPSSAGEEVSAVYK